MFRRSVMVTAFASAMVVALVVPAEAAPRTRAVVGPFHATSTIAPGCLQFVQQTVDGVIRAWGPAPVGFHLSYCIGLPPDNVHFPTTGTFDLTLGNNKAVFGSLDGNVEALNLTPSGFPLHLRLTVTGGTGSFLHATGTVTLEGFFSIGAVTADGSASGSISK